MKKADLRQFNYQQVGQADADMWRAYYNHQFLKLFWFLLKLIKNQLGLSWYITVRLAYYSAWAAADYRINRDNVNSNRVLKNITKFYKLMSKHSTQPFDFILAGKLELAWWDIHRSSHKNNPALEKAIANTLATIYQVDPARLKNCAHYRAEATILPRHKGDSSKNQTDWPKIEELTVKSWQALHEVVNKI